jgi:hypothetical protein
MDCFNIKAGIESELLPGWKFKKAVLANNVFCNIAQQLGKTGFKFINIHGVSPVGQAHKNQLEGL